MTEIGNELMKLKGASEEEQRPHREKFHLLEDEQISIRNLVFKIKNWLKSEE